MGQPAPQRTGRGGAGLSDGEALDELAGMDWDEVCEELGVR